MRVPAWMGLNKVLGPRGTITWSLLASHAEREFQHALHREHPVRLLLALPPDAVTMSRPESCGVVYSGVPLPHFEHPAADLADLVDYSLAIYRGRVSGQSEGVSTALPARLIGLAVIGPIKESDEVAQRRVWMVYPSARFIAEGTTICRWDPRFSPVPEEGDQVLLFVFERPADDGGRIVPVVDPRFLVTERKGGGRLILPSLFLDSGELDSIAAIDGVEQRVRDLLRRSGRRRRDEGRGEVSVIPH